MAHPKRKISKQRARKRRTVCGECGYYRGKLAIEKMATA